MQLPASPSWYTSSIFHALELQSILLGHNSAAGKLALRPANMNLIPEACFNLVGKHTI
jgi:hypothetical protein